MGSFSFSREAFFSCFCLETPRTNNENLLYLLLSKKNKKTKILPSVFASPSPFSTVLSVCVFIYCDILSLPFVCVMFCYTSLLVVSIISLPLPTPHPPTLSFMILCWWLATIFSVLSPSQRCLSLLYSPYYPCPVLLFPRFILCPILTYFTAEYCFSFFIGPGPLSLHPQQQACFFTTPRPKVGATHWSFCWWEQNVMDFHLHSQMWLQRCIRVFIRRGQEVIHHGTTWEHLTVL